MHVLFVTCRNIYIILADFFPNSAISTGIFWEPENLHLIGHQPFETLEVAICFEPAGLSLDHWLDVVPGLDTCSEHENLLKKLKIQILNGCRGLWKHLIDLYFIHFNVIFLGNRVRRGVTTSFVPGNPPCQGSNAEVTTSSELSWLKNIYHAVLLNGLLLPSFLINLTSVAMLSLNMKKRFKPKLVNPTSFLESFALKIETLSCS